MAQPSQRTDTRFDVEHVLLKVDEAVRFGFSSDRLIVEHLRRRVRMELPLSSAAILARFANWTPLLDAFSDPNQDLELAFALVKALVASRIFMVRGRDIPSDGIPVNRWRGWEGALTYHLESRTTADEAYLTADESAALLAAKAKDHPRPSSFKDYSTHPFCSLPNPEGGHQRFLDVLLARRTSRSFSRAPMSTTQLSTLLFLTWGCTGAWVQRLGNTPFLMKTSPSGGSLHSVEVYPLVLNVSGLPSGIYHYSVRHHSLELLSQEDPREWLGKGCADQDWAGDCCAVFVMTAVLERMMWKYPQPRAYRVLLFDIGHLSQTFALVATHLGLGSFVTAALRDEVFEQKLGLDHLEEPVFLLTGAGVPSTGLSL